ncbi:dnaJ homolog subfamily C member 30, mitochondrial-like [Haematobia irritans]|uniref:dnaJ homolog subfamily C member 30, mitochondrial-like n=1 Tax=Haematobia irritans TaxID=7368 RepID=UPI003F501611
MLPTKRPYLFLRNIWAIQNFPTRVNISTGNVKYANHYEVLGISKKSTQGEIKAAYYRLSMLYHPDKNQGSESAAVKFREITQAYEVLGNYKLRRLYDKGIIHTAGSQYADMSQDSATKEEEVEEDPSTKFYKSRFKKSKVADSEGRTPIYDFDEWQRQHYGHSFQRRQTAKQKYDRNKAQEKDSALVLQNEILLFAIMVLSALAYLKFYSDSSYDTPKQKAIRAKSETGNDSTR